jgi:aminocarboxymuconate-semialdehyde decarboxylase
MVVDVHTHFFPRSLGDRAASTGDPRWPSLAVDDTGQARIMTGSSIFRPVAQTCWDLSRRLDAMDATGVDVQVLSPVPVMLTTWADDAPALEFAKEVNDAIATAAAVAPTRLLWLGTVPLQNTEAAIVEMERGLSLGMAGIEIGTEVRGRELDHPTLRPFFVAAAERQVPLFIHPTDATGAIRRKGQPYEFGLGMLTDTAMAAGALIFGGVLDECPGLRVGLAHGCGSLPWTFPRMARAATLGIAPERFQHAIDHSAELFGRLWADTLVFAPSLLEIVVSRLGANHLFLGSDFPFYPPEWGAPTEVIDGVVAAGCCSAAEGAAMKGANGLAFLGRQ